MIKLKVKLSITVEALIYAMLVIFFYRPASYVLGGRLTQLFGYLNYALFTAGALFLLFVVCRGYYRVSLTAVLIAVLFLWVNIGATFLSQKAGNAVSWAEAIPTTVTILLYIFFCDFGLYHNPKRFLRTFIVVASVVCILNALTFFVYGYHGGMNPQKELLGRRLSDNYFLLAEDNATFFWTWPALLVMWYYYYLYNRSKTYGIYTAAVTALVIASYLYMWSVMAALACLAIPGLLIFFDRRIKKVKPKGRGDYSIKFVVYAAIGVAVQVLISTQDMLSSFSMLLLTYFNKDVTLSGRTLIWERAEKFIADSPLVGYGYETTEFTTQKILINHTHNMYLETLYRGGIIAIILFALVLLSMYFYARRTNKNALYDFLIALFLVFLVIATVEFAFYRYHYLILFLLLAHTELLPRKARNRRMLDIGGR